EHLSKRFRCIAFDRRECGQSGGRVEAITWSHYVAQARGLLEHLGIARAHLMGGCMGCAPVVAFAEPNGLQAVVGLVRKEGKAFGAEPRGGPWASVIARDAAFAERYARM